MSNIVLYVCNNRRPVFLGYAAACTQFVFWVSLAEWSLKIDDKKEKYIYTGLSSLTALAIPLMIQFYLSRKVKSITFIKDLQKISIQSHAFGVRPSLYPSSALKTTESLLSKNPKTNFDLILSAERHGRKPIGYLIDRDGSFCDKQQWDNIFYQEE